MLSDISGKSGQAIIGAILSGERDPVKLAGLCDRRVQASAAEVAESLRGNWRDEMLFELGQARESYQFSQQQIQSCDRKLESYLKVLPTRQVEITLPPQGAFPVPASKARKASRGNTPDIPGMSEELARQLWCGSNHYRWHQHHHRPDYSGGDRHGHEPFPQ